MGTSNSSGPFPLESGDINFRVPGTPAQRRPRRTASGVVSLQPELKLQFRKSWSRLSDKGFLWQACSNIDQSCFSFLGRILLHYGSLILPPPLSASQGYMSPKIGLNIASSETIFIGSTEVYTSIFISVIESNLLSCDLAMSTSLVASIVRQSITARAYQAGLMDGPEKWSR